MIDTTVDIQWNGDEYKRLTDEALDAGAGGMAVVFGTEVARSMPGAGASATASGKNGRLRFTPSNIGEPPGVRTGRLRSSIQQARESQGVWRVGTNVLYGAVHELSTRFRRPFMMPQVRSSTTRKRMVDAFISRAARVLERGAK